MKRSREPEEDGSAYDEQDAAVVPAPKIITIDHKEPNDAQSAIAAIHCSLPGHAPVSFTNYGDYEHHYTYAHTNQCFDCRRNFPSPHMLDLHIRELHDALTQIRGEKGEKIYACFVETCEDKFKALKMRRDHLVNVHMFPRNYFFAVTKFGIDRRQSMLVEYRKNMPAQRKAPASQRGKPEDDPRLSATVDGQGEVTGTLEDVTMGDGVETLAEEKPEESDRHSGASKDVLMSDGRSSTAKKPEEPGRDVGTLKDHSMNDEGALAEAEQKPRTKTAIVDTEMENLTGAMSSLRFVPRTLRLGAKKAGSASK